MSVIDHVDELLVWDTGSQDNTIKIIETISSPKIKLRILKEITAEQYPTLRQQMLDQSSFDWIMILDGDEIWPEESITAHVKAINSHPQLEYLTSASINCVGDVFHRQPEIAGRYHLGGRSGHLNLRFMNRAVVPGLHFDEPYGQEGLFDNTSTRLQDRRPTQTIFIPHPYLHTTHLPRSPFDDKVMQRRAKFKYEIGFSLPKNFHFPISFYLPHPQIVPSPWSTPSLGYTLQALIQTPLRLFKRLIT